MSLSMPPKSFKDKYEARRFASRSQVGLYARTLVWDDVLKFTKANLWRFLPLIVAPGAISIPASLLFKNSVSERWIFVGAMSSSGFWLAIIFVILRTGVGPTLMGIEGENKTADVLRVFASGEWQLINGVKFPGRGDIDHVLVGPGGIFVIESTWSKQRWPMDGEQWRYITGVLEDAVIQVKKNSEDASKRLESLLGDLPVHTVLVLWSSIDSSKDFPWRFRRNVYRVRGPELISWLRSLPKLTDDTEVIGRASSAFRKFALDQNEIDANNRSIYRPTLDRFMIQSIVSPYVAFVGAGYLLRLIGLKHNLWLSIGSVVVFIGIGFAGTHAALIRRSAQCWLAASLLSLFVLLVAEIAILAK